MTKKEGRKQKKICLKYPVVEVLWEDTYDTAEWLSKKEADRHSTVLCASRGHLWRKNKKEVVLAMVVAGDGSAGMLSAIPRSCVRKIRKRKKL